ncbi:MAG TPA: ATP-dependent DNA helicase RecG, partial [Candidatus Desulfofervidus auxilii]|nr:ATP-dependent DNA helicase RecG [Candidatus Desulfofervidus auxilii]
RLLQGDVGSGKTILALLATLIAIESGYQVAIMAPTEILAEQHFENAQRLLKNLPIKLALLTSQLKSKEKQAIYEGILKGRYQLVIGTHALIQEGVEFQRLGLVIIDEQHRFGVAQRATLVAKGVTPDVLVMTATPIPRTLAMTLYGDLDISILDEMPPGRKPVETMHFWEKDREQVYRFLEEKLSEGVQVYIVYPLIEESEILELKAATTMYETLKKRFSQYKLALLHGRMKAEEKQEIMTLFRTGSIDILVATTVIEVGVDVPQASVMVIEHAERFGLAQLHQLRGRVGRGTDQAYCLLLTPEKITSLAKQRLKAIIETNDGFKIAEADLRLRGPGEILGTKQAGFPELRFADMIKDIEILKQAREAAFHIIATDPELRSSEYKYLASYLRHYWGEKLKLGMVG